jgi:hypothetical protein
MSINQHDVDEGVVVNQRDATSGCSRQAKSSAEAFALNGPALCLVSSTAVTVPGGSLVPAPTMEQSRPTGVAFVGSEDHSGGRLYVCDPDTHIIDVLDEKCRPLFSFGGLGSGPGQLDTPTDIAVVRIDATGVDGAAVDAALLVVADRGNHRLQVFELDGAFVREIGGHAGAWMSDRGPLAAGSPFFRLGDVPPLPFPSRLDWRAPYLDVTGSGTVIRIDLAVVVLPDFANWIANAPPAELRLAFLRFVTDPNRDSVPEACVYEILERLQPPPLRAAALAQ